MLAREDCPSWGGALIPQDRLRWAEPRHETIRAAVHPPESPGPGAGQLGLALCPQPAGLSTWASPRPAGPRLVPRQEGAGFWTCRPLWAALCRVCPGPRGCGSSWAPGRVGAGCWARPPSLPGHRLWACEPSHNGSRRPGLITASLAWAAPLTKPLRRRTRSADWARCWRVLTTGNYPASQARAVGAQPTSSRVPRSPDSPLATWPSR